ncbi:hypothetical protein V6N13_021709 [Hibiscus sabdariffa]
MVSLYDKLTFLACDGWSWGCPAETTVETAAALVAAVLAIFFFTWWWAKKLTKTNPPLPPGPRGLPLLGSLPFLKPELHSYFRELSETYGPIFKLQLGTRTCIVINSPPIAKEILKDQDAIFANRDIPVATVIGMFGGVNVAWRQNGPEYSRLRKFLIREMLSKNSLEASYSLRRREILQMVKDIHGKTGSSVKLGEQVALTTVKVMISSLWGGSSEKSNDLIEMRGKLEELVRLMGSPNVSDILPVFAPFDLQGIESKSRNIVLWFYGIFESVIKKRLKTGDDESKDFLQVMLEMNRRGDNKTSLTDMEVKALLLDMLIGGTDTIPTTVAIDNCLGGGTKDVTKLPMHVTETHAAKGHIKVFLLLSILTLKKPIPGHFPHDSQLIRKARSSCLRRPFVELQCSWIRSPCGGGATNSLLCMVLKDQDAIFANRELPAAAIVGTFGGLDIAWRPNGPDLNRLRKLVIREIMSKRSLDACYELRRREIRQMVKDIHRKIGSPVNLGEQVAQTAVKVMISTLWGGSSERSSDLIELRKRLDEFVRLFLAPNISDIFPVLAPFDLQGIVSKSKKHISWFYGIFESVIMNRLKIAGDGKKIVDEINKDFLQQMLELNQQGEDKTSLSINELKAVLLDRI